jgi:hypothetical protein
MFGLKQGWVSLHELLEQALAKLFKRGLGDACQTVAGNEACEATDAKQQHQHHRYTPQGHVTLLKAFV